MRFIRALTGLRGRTKFDLVRSLAKERVSGDPMAEAMGFNAAMVDSLNRNLLAGLPEAGIVTNVETYLSLKQQGLSDETAFAAIEAHRSDLGAGTLPSPCDLRSYIKYRVALENKTGVRVAEDFIDKAIDQSIAFFQK